MVSFFGIGDKVQFEVQSIKDNNPSYVATALSTDTQMGTDSVIECVYENGEINAYASWTTRDPRKNAERDDVVTKRIFVHISYLFALDCSTFSYTIFDSHKIHINYWNHAI